MLAIELLLRDVRWKGREMNCIAANKLHLGDHRATSRVQGLRY
jgi:hypothetical protein